jgi:hypothetical protein
VLRRKPGTRSDVDGERLPIRTLGKILPEAPRGRAAKSAAEIRAPDSTAWLQDSGRRLRRIEPFRKRF